METSLETTPEEVITNDITLSQEELFTEVSQRTMLPLEDVTSVMKTFIQIHLKKLKLV